MDDTEPRKLFGGLRLGSDADLQIDIRKKNPFRLTI